jgi:hypothetical protein
MKTNFLFILLPFVSGGFPCPGGVAGLKARHPAPLVA